MHHIGPHLALQLLLSSRYYHSCRFLDQRPYLGFSEEKYFLYFVMQSLCSEVQSILMHAACDEPHL